MQYDIKKMLENKAVFRLVWHGETTFVQLNKKDVEKTEVNSGDIIEVSMKLAKALLTSNDRWTMEGDEPIEQGYLTARKDAIKARDAKFAARKAAKAGKKVVDNDEGDDESVELNEDAIAAMKGKALRAELDKREVEYPKSMGVADLKELLLETINGATEDDNDDGDDESAENEDEGDDNDVE